MSQGTVEVRYLPGRRTKCERSACTKPAVVNVLTTNPRKRGSAALRARCLCVYHGTKLVVRYHDADQLILLARYVTRWHA